MKVAIIIAGHMRCWNQMFPYFKANFIDRYNPDIFISTWNDEGWWKWGNEKGVYERSPDIFFDEVRDLYNPVSIIHEDYDLFDSMFKKEAERFKNTIGWPKNVISQTYRWNKGLNLLQYHIDTTGKQYDFIIRTRTDLEILGQLPEINPSKFYTLHNEYAQGGINDVINIGNLDSITKMNTMYLQLDDLYKRTNTFCAHIFAQEIVKKYNLELISLPIPYRLWNTPWGQHQDVDRHIAK